jgi:hypothetical protein
MLLTPLELPGWIEFNERRTTLKADRFSFALTSNGPEIRAVLYLDRRGRVRVPVNNPFLPIVFRSARQHPSGRSADWFKVAEPLAEEMRRRGVVNATSLPPDVEDVRPWSWLGFSVGVAYTYLMDLPFDAVLADGGSRRTTDKAAKLGMTVETVRDVESVIECLTDTVERKGLSHGMGLRDLRSVASLLDSDNLRMYTCFDHRGRAASSVVVLHAPGTRAVGLVGGTKAQYLADGAGYRIWPYVFDDLSAAGATGLDLCGANIPTVARFKARWGARLVPTYHVRTYSARAGARFLANWRRSYRRGSSAGPGGSAQPAGSRSSGSYEPRSGSAERSIPRMSQRDEG